MSIRSFLSSTRTNIGRNGFNTFFQDVKYGGPAAGEKAYVAIGTDNGFAPDVFQGCARSTDGSNWTEHKLGIERGGALARTLNLWGVAGTDNSTSTSPDGITWTPGAAPYTRVNALTATANRFVAILPDDSIYADSDLNGDSSQTATVPGRVSPLTHIAAIPAGGVLAVGSKDIARCNNSFNIATWTRIAAPWTGDVTALGIVGTTVLVCTRSVIPAGIAIWRSLDSGVIWTRVFNSSVSSPVQSLAYNGLSWVGSGTIQGVYASRNGTDWTYVPLGTSGYRCASNGTDFVHFTNRTCARFSVEGSLVGLGL